VTAFHASAFEAIGTTAQVVVTDPDALPAARALLARELGQLDRAASRFRPDSELVLLNQARGQARRVSPLLLEALFVAVRAATLTDGIVSPMVGRTLRLAGYDTTFALVAGREGRRVNPRFATVGDWRLLELDEERQTARIPAGVELDLGATAKALAADRAAATIAGAASCGVLVNLGGDISVAGAAPAGGWAIRLADHHASPPDRPGPAIAVKSGGLATSSTAARRWRTASGELHHVIDPRTGRPARTPWQTVTVAAATCVDANIASTSALVLGDDAVEWLDSRGLPARIIAADGSTVCTGGWSPELA
jgi:FAD:protein FMN transferase